MCRSAAEGGQRCAAHTRPRFLAATFGTAEWDDAATAYASTPEGAARLTASADSAESSGNYQVAAQVRSALLRGNATREANREAAQRIRNTVPAVTETANHIQNFLDAQRYLNPILPVDGDLGSDELRRNITEADMLRFAAGQTRLDMTVALAARTIRKSRPDVKTVSVYLDPTGDISRVDSWTGQHWLAGGEAAKVRTLIEDHLDTVSRAEIADGLTRTDTAFEVDIDEYNALWRN